MLFMVQKTPTGQLELFTDSGEPVAPYSPATTTLLAKIAGVKYPSELKKLRREAADPNIPTDEVDAVFGAMAARRNQLVARDTEPPVDAPEQTPLVEPEEPWSPTAILDRLPQGPREPDWFERQLPPGDRD